LGLLGQDSLGAFGLGELGQVLERSSLPF